MKKSSNILGKYSEGQMKKKNTKSEPAIVNYEQLYKGPALTKKVTDTSRQTLEEKIAKRAAPSNVMEVTQVEVEIGNTTYLVSTPDDVTEEHIRKVASLADEIYMETKDNNQYTTTHKLAVLSLFEACDRLLRVNAENQSLKTEIMYYKQKADLADKKDSEKLKPTPMEELSGRLSSDK